MGVATRRRTNSGTDNLPPLQHAQPRGCGVQYAAGAILRHSATPTPLFEHEHSRSDVAPRSALPRAQNRPRKRGTLHKKNVGEVGSTRTILMRLVSIFNPLRGCNSNLAQYSNTPALHHSAWPDSRTRTKRLVRAGSWCGCLPGV